MRPVPKLMHLFVNVKPAPTFHFLPPSPYLLLVHSYPFLSFLKGNCGDLVGGREVGMEHGKGKDFSPSHGEWKKVSSPHQATTIPQKTKTSLFPSFILAPPHGTCYLLTLIPALNPLLPPRLSCSCPPVAKAYIQVTVSHAGSGPSTVENFVYFVGDFSVGYVTNLFNGMMRYY